MAPSCADASQSNLHLGVSAPFRCVWWVKNTGGGDLRQLWKLASTSMKDNKTQVNFQLYNFCSLGIWIWTVKLHSVSHFTCSQMEIKWPFSPLSPKWRIFVLPSPSADLHWSSYPLTNCNWHIECLICYLFGSSGNLKCWQAEDVSHWKQIPRSPPLKVDTPQGTPINKAMGDLLFLECLPIREEREENLKGIGAFFHSVSSQFER